MGTTLGLGEALDNPESLRFNNSPNQAGAGNVVYPTMTGVTAGLQGGNGFSNNAPFPLTGAADFGDQNVVGVQGYGTYNNGFFSRLKKIVDTTNIGNTSQCLYGTSAATGAGAINVMNTNNLTTEFKPYYQALNNYGVVYDVAVIRLKDIFDSMQNFPMTKRADGQLKLYLNCGAVATAILPSVGTGTLGGTMATSASTSTFTNTCPLMQSALVGANTYGTSAVGIVSGLSIAKSLTTNLFGVNLASSQAQHFMPSCRLYYPQVVLKPEKLHLYISENRNKKVVYKSIIFNQFNNINSGSTFSQLIQSGVKNIKSLIVIPFQSSSVNGSINTTATTGSMTGGVTSFAQYQSPFDPAPASNCNISLTNFQVQVGGINIFQQGVLSYTFENFIEQVSPYEKINGSDLGLSCGLINQYMWENSYRVYFANCERGALSDFLEPRNVVLSFVNNTQLTIDIQVFVEFYNDFSIDVETGLIRQ